MKATYPMDSQHNISVAISAELYAQLEALAKQLDRPLEEVVEQALRDFMSSQPSQPEERPIRQGDLYWVEKMGSSGELLAHPHVVLQDDIFNQSRLDTVIVCALTSNPKKASFPGNILLDDGEGNLPKQSVLEISKISSIPTYQLGEYIGQLSAARIQQILAGLRFIQRSNFTR